MCNACRYCLGWLLVAGHISSNLIIYTNNIRIAYTSIYLTVSFTVERYISVCHPLRGQVLCTESRAKRVITGTWNIHNIRISEFIIIHFTGMRGGKIAFNAYAFACYWVLLWIMLICSMFTSTQEEFPYEQTFIIIAILVFSYNFMNIIMYTKYLLDIFCKDASCFLHTHIHFHANRFHAHKFIVSCKLITSYILALMERK